MFDVAERIQELLQLEMLKSDTKLQKSSTESSSNGSKKLKLQQLKLQLLNGSRELTLHQLVEEIRHSHKKICLCKAKMLSYPYTYLVIDFIICSHFCFGSSTSEDSVR